MHICHAHAHTQLRTYQIQIQKRDLDCYYLTFEFCYYLLDSKFLSGWLQSRHQKWQLKLKTRFQALFQALSFKESPNGNVETNDGCKIFPRARGKKKTFIVFTYFTTLSGLSTLPKAFLYFHAINWQLRGPLKY